MHPADWELTHTAVLWEASITDVMQAAFQASNACTPALCEGGGDVVGVVTPLVRGGAQVLHGDQVVELSVLPEVHEREEEGEDGEGQIEVEGEDVEIKERRTWMTMRMI